MFLGRSGSLLLPLMEWTAQTNSGLRTIQRVPFAYATCPTGRGEQRQRDKDTPLPVGILRDALRWRLGGKARWEGEGRIVEGSAVPPPHDASCPVAQLDPSHARILWEQARQTRARVGEYENPHGR